MAKKGGSSFIGTIFYIVIGAAILAYVVNLLLDKLKAISTSTDTNSTISSLRPIVTAAIIMVAVLAIVYTAGQMMSALGGV